MKSFLLGACVLYLTIVGIAGDYGAHIARGEIPLFDLPTSFGDTRQPYFFQMRFDKIKIPLTKRCDSVKYPLDVVS